MTAPAAELPQQKPPIATGWLLWLTWAFVVLLGLSLMHTILFFVVGPDALQAILRMPYRVPAVTGWWILKQATYLFFGVACVGVLLRDRDWASLAINAAWVIVGIQCIDAALQIFRLRLSIPIGAILYVTFALKTGRVLRGATVQHPVAPPGSRGML